MKIVSKEEIAIYYSRRTPGYVVSSMELASITKGDIVKTASIEEIESFRPRLLGLAYRMLGSVVDAEDVVQDALVRYQQASDILSSESWLVKVTTRLCIDHLRKAKRREEYKGPWLPEPVSESWDGASGDRVELAESLSMAFMVLLETLSPPERAAYLLREVFGYEFNEIASLLDKSEENARQIATRARKRLDQKERRFTPEAGKADDLANRFFAACRSGDLSAIESMLAKDAVYYSDGGGKVHAAPRPIIGTQQIANLLSVVFRKYLNKCEFSLTNVNGQLGAVFFKDGQPILIHTFAQEQGSISEIYAVLNPDKLSHWPAPLSLEKNNADSNPMN